VVEVLPKNILPHFERFLSPLERGKKFFEDILMV
jgi:hypothetical protein